MIKTFGPATSQRADKSFEVSCVTSATYCFLLQGKNCTDVKPHREVENTRETPEWCKYRAQSIQDVIDIIDMDAMGLTDMTRAELVQMMKGYPVEFRGIAYGKTKPRRLNEMDATHLRDSILAARRAEDKGGQHD